MGTWVAVVIGVSSLLLLKMFAVQFWRTRPYLDQQGAIASSGSIGPGRHGAKKEGVMLWTVAVILLVLWALGIGTAYTGGGLVHVLLVIAAIVVLFQFLGGRRRTVWRRRCDARAVNRSRET
jgi:hypothetical protein